MDNKVFEEFYCNDCDGFICVRLNKALNFAVKVRCPNCGHEHPRKIVDGIIMEDGKCSEGSEIICPPKSAYSKKALMAPKHARSAAVLDGRSPELDAIIKDSWRERFGNDPD